MTDSPAQNALKSSAAALIVAVACVASFLPPLARRTVETPLTAAAVGVALATALLLHWVFLAIGAHRLRRSPAGWLALAALFPVGSVASLVLLGWFSQEAAAPAATTA